MGACYEWLEKRGLKPDGIKSMHLGEGPDLIAATGERQKMCQLTFECEEPTGKLCWDDDGNYFVYATTADIPWPIPSDDSEVTSLATEQIVQ